MANVEIQLDGFKELQQKLKEFGAKIEANGLRSANAAGARVIVASVKAAAPLSLWKYDKHQGLLKDSIRYFKRTSPEFTVTHAVGVTGVYLKYANTATNRRKGRVGKKYKADGPAFYAKFLEFGSSKQFPKPFMRPAFLSSVDSSIDAIREGMGSAIEREAAKR